MKGTRGNGWSLRTPLLLAAFAGIAASASGCIIDASNGPVDSDRDGVFESYLGTTAVNVRVTETPLSPTIGLSFP